MMVVVSGDASTNHVSESDLVGAGRDGSSERPIVFLVGRALPGRSGVGAPDASAGSGADITSVITSEIVDAGGVLIDLAHDVIAARFDCVADAVEGATRVNGGSPELPALGSALRCWAVHVTDTRSFGGIDHVGVALRRTAAISAIGHAGQLLVSDPAWSALAAGSKMKVGSVDLGVHRLGALPRPERIWQLGGRRDGFPVLRSTGESRQNLPSTLSPLIGRNDQVVEIGSLLARERLITLTGSGGVGKTRLALASAAATVSSFDRTCWVDLANVVEPHGLPGAILEAVGLWRAAKLPLAALVAEFERERVLLVVDNCEHLIDAVADFFGVLLANAHGVVLLATSRQPLGLTGEVTYRVPSLAFPPRTVSESIGAASAARYSAVELFVDRATRAQPAFRLDEDTAAVVASLCHHLDGIPLAIELVAAQVRHLSVVQIANDVNGSLGRLRDTRGGTVGRHSTIKSSIDWSYERLNPIEQQVLRCVGVFAGLCPLQAVVDVYDATGGSPGVVPAGMSQLCDKNLVVSEPGPTGPDYRLLHVVRTYTRERAMDAGELDRLSDAHAEWWTRWIEHRTSTMVAENLAIVDRYYANLLGAMRWVVDRPVPALRLLTSLAKVSQNLGHARDIVPLAERLLTEELADQHPSEWLSAAIATSLRYDLVGSYAEFQQFLVRIRRVAERNNDLFRLTIADFQLGDSRAVCEALQHQAIERHEPWLAALAATLAAQYDAENDPRTGLRTLDDARIVDLADEQLTSFQHRIRGRIARDLGEFDQALTYADRLSSSRSELMIENAARLMSQIGLLTRNVGLVEEALAIAEKSLHGPYAAAATQRFVHMIRLLEASEPSRVDDLLDADSPIAVGRLWLLCREAIDAGSPDIALRRIEWRLASGPFSTAVAAGVKAVAVGDARDAHEALRIAAEFRYPLIAIDALERLAVQANQSGRPVDAARLLGAAERARAETQYRWRYPNEHRVVEAARRAMLHSGDQVLVEAYAEGSALSIPDAAEYANRARGERRRPRHGWDALTPTERKVVELVTEGLTNPQIAGQLLMSRSTVKTHLEHIYIKTALHNRTELAAKTARRASSKS